MAATKFSRLEVALWRQFESVSIDFHPRLTVLTGANGAGKSTLISILARHFGWQRPYLSVPKKSKEGGLAYLSGIVVDILKRFSFRSEHANSIGSITYDDGSTSQIIITDSSSWNSDISFTAQNQLSGLLIDSHRPSPSYSQVGQIPLQPMTAQASFNNYNSEMQSRYHGHHGGTTPLYRMKESIISMGIFGEGNSTLGGGNSELLKTLTGFDAVLRDLLPTSLGFQRIAIRSPEVVLITDSGEFMLDASSGGIMTLIDTAWRIYMFSRNKDAFVVLMDEPENHLHPSMQRTLMRRLLIAFPKAQFIIATHSPFMVSSVRDSNVVVLRYVGDENADRMTADVGLPANRRVVSKLLDKANKAGNANEILREVLGVPATTPEWVEEEMHSILNKYRGKQLTTETVAELRKDVEQFGFNEYFPEALAGFAKQQNDQAT